LHVQHSCQFLYPPLKGIFGSGVYYFVVFQPVVLFVTFCSLVRAQQGEPNKKEQLLFRTIKTRQRLLFLFQNQKLKSAVTAFGYSFAIIPCRRRLGELHNIKSFWYTTA
jgi:hypothetical protein